MTATQLSVALLTARQCEVARWAVSLVVSERPGETGIRVVGRRILIDEAGEGLRMLLRVLIELADHAIPPAAPDRTAMDGAAWYLASRAISAEAVRVVREFYKISLD